MRYVASHSNIERQLNQRFIESITPIVRQAVEKAVSAMVVSGLSGKVEEVEKAEVVDVPVDETAPIIDPDNSRIVTTYTERELFNVIKKILGNIDIVSKDTESYFNVLYQNKSNRWIVRYYDNKQRPSIQLPIEMTEDVVKEATRAGLEVSGTHIIIDYPENILRISGLIRDCLEFCQNDENFARKKV